MRVRENAGRRSAIGIGLLVELFNERIIDKYIQSSMNGEAGNKPANAMLWAELSVLNKPGVYANYSKIINSKYTSDDAVQKMILRNEANKELNRIVEKQIERIAKNVDYTEQVLNKYDFMLDDYHKIINEQKKNSVKSRRQVIEQVLKQREIINQSEGLNIPNTYSYRNLDVLTEQLHLEAQSKSQFTEVLEMNKEAIANNKSPIYTEKKWVWSHKVNTRHIRMGRYPPIPIDETFTVIHDVTKQADEMLYPRDTDGSPANVYGCKCSIDYS